MGLTLCPFHRRDRCCSSSVDHLPHQPHHRRQHLHLRLHLPPQNQHLHYCNQGAQFQPRLSGRGG